MRAHGLAAAILLLTSVGINAAEAQFGRIRDRSQTLGVSTRGGGRLEVAGETRSLDRASVLLRRNGDAEIRFYRGSTAYVFTGRWSGDRGRVVDLDLVERDNVSIQANGRAYLQRDGNLERVEINGRERGGRLRVSFQTEEIASTASTGEWRRNIRGSGRLEVGSQNRGLDKAAVVLQPNGRAEVCVYRGSTPYVFTGQWFGDRSRRVELRLSQRDGVTCRANGWINFQRGDELGSIEINGRERDQQLSVLFQADGYRGGGGGAFDYILKSDEVKAGAK